MDWPPSSGLTYEIRATDAGAVMADVGVLIEPQVKAKGLIYDVRRPADPVLVWADADKLRQVLLNLLANAIRYTPSGGRITTEISMRSATPDLVYLRVRDTGVGIERQKQDLIFDPFVTLRRAFAEGTEGTGLGLTISRELARGMGGDLRVRSAEGKGSTFTITLRRAINEAAVDARTEDDGQNGARTDLPDHYRPNV